MAIFGPKPWKPLEPFGNHGTLWKNVRFSPLSSFCFYSLERLFFVLEYRERHFPGLYCLKKKFGKMAIFGPKP